MKGGLALRDTSKFARPRVDWLALRLSHFRGFAEDSFFDLREDVWFNPATADIQFETPPEQGCFLGALGDFNHSLEESKEKLMARLTDFKVDPAFLEEVKSSDHAHWAEKALQFYRETEGDIKFASVYCDGNNVEFTRQFYDARLPFWTKSFEQIWLTAEGKAEIAKFQVLIASLELGWEISRRVQKNASFLLRQIREKKVAERARLVCYFNRSLSDLTLTERYPVNGFRYGVGSLESIRYYSKEWAEAQGRSRITGADVTNELVLRLGNVRSTNLNKEKL